MLIELIITGSVFTQIPAPQPDFSAPGLSGLTTIAGWISAIVLVVCLIGALVSAAIIGAGKALDNGKMQSGGLAGLIGSGIGVAVCASAAVILNATYGVFS